MCGICGCSETQHIHVHDEKLIQIEQDLFSKNNQYAEQNKQKLLKQKILPINLMSSPGSGKTTLLSQTITDLKNQIKMSVIVGDQQTNHDAEQIKAAGSEVLQINTGKTCHLDAHMLGHALESLPMQNNSILFIENIGNLVCPALFNLGESYKVVILSVAEGDNKPLKYQEMFRVADLVLITKSDLLAYVPFNMEQCYSYIKQINPKADILSLSVLKNNGLDAWYHWLQNKYATIQN